MYDEGMDKKCPLCGSPLKRGANKYCSNKCKGEGRRLATLASRPKCLTCGEPVRLPKYKFCSLICAGKARKVRTECPVCGNEVIPPRTYCSVTCGHVGRGNRPIGTFSCRRCGIEFQRHLSNVKNPDNVFCSGTCRAASRVYKRGEDHPQYKPSWHYVNSDGYVVVGKKPLVLEHRLVMEQMLGRPLSKGETVHHINGIKSDNRPENLQLRQGNHGKGSRFVCGDCGSHNILPMRLPETHHVELAANLEVSSEIK